MSWKENISTIKEIFHGHYQIILDFASNKFLDYVLDESYKYVWVNSHEPFFDWQPLSLPLYHPQINTPVLVRKLTYDFIMPTTEFKAVQGKLSAGIKLIQLIICQNTTLIR